MRTFSQDIKDYLEGKTTKEEFVQAVQKGAGTNNENGAYDFLKAVDEAKYLEKQFSYKEFSYKESKKLVEAFDNICYSQEDKTAHENGIKVNDGYILNKTRAAVIALNALDTIRHTLSGKLALEDFYKEQNRKFDGNYIKFGLQASIVAGALLDEEVDTKKKILGAKLRIGLNHEKNTQLQLTADAWYGGVRGADKIARERIHGKDLNEAHPQPLTTDEAKEYIADPKAFIEKISSKTH